MTKNPVPMSDEEFLQRINGKDEGAFRRLFADFYNALVSYAMGFVARQDVAEDIVQDLFVVLWERAAPFASYDSFKTFLYHSVRNASLNHLKRGEVEAKYVAAQSEIDESPDDIDRKIMEEELYRLLFATIDELPPACKRVFELHLEGKGNEEIAALLRLSVETVKTQKKRAMAYLRERLGDAYFLLLAMRLLPWLDF